MLDVSYRYEYRLSEWRVGGFLMNLGGVSSACLQCRSAGMRISLDSGLPSCDSRVRQRHRKEVYNCFHEYCDAMR